MKFLLPAFTSALLSSTSKTQQQAALQKESAVNDRRHKTHHHSVSKISSGKDEFPYPNAKPTPAPYRAPPPQHHLKDLEKTSDKEFYGPPYPGDYQLDENPKTIPEERGKQEFPYPAVKTDYDSDFINDTDSDGGAWEAQMKYDQLRARAMKLEEEEVRSEQRLEEEQVGLDNEVENTNKAAGRMSHAQHEWEMKELEKQRLGAAVKDKLDSVNRSQSEVEMRAKEYNRAKKEMEEASIRLRQAQDDMKDAEQGVEGLEDARHTTDEAKASLDQERQSYEESSHRVDEHTKRRDEAARIVAEQKRVLNGAQGEAEAARRALGRFDRGDYERRTGNVGGYYNAGSALSTFALIVAVVLF